MEPERVVAYVALAWLIGSLLCMMRSIRKGRELAEALATRHPETYEALGRPRPGYLESARRTRFARFVGRREFEQLPDGALVAEFETYRKSEARLIVAILASGALVALAAFALQRAV